MVSDPFRTIGKRIPEDEFAILTLVDYWHRVVLDLARFPFFCVSVNPRHEALASVTHGWGRLSVRSKFWVCPEETEFCSSLEPDNVRVWSKGLMPENRCSEVGFVVDKHVLGVIAQKIVREC
jgi:hypothetical protein